MPSASLAHLRRFLLRAQRLEQPVDSIAETLDHLGYVQIDPINVCGRMHDLILRNRVLHYPENGLHSFLLRPEQPGFEYYLPGAGILVTFPLSAWPYVRPHMESRRNDPNGYNGRLQAEETAIAEDILSEITTRGPLSSDHFRHDTRVTGAWGTRTRQAKAVLEKLFMHGRVLIARREKFRRIYDLPERVIPASVFNQPPADATAVERWLILTRLRQRRLTTLSKKQQTLVADCVAPVLADGFPPLWILHRDLPLLAATEEAELPDLSPRLIAPLDPLIYDRKLTARIWNFDYRWEVYTPAAKRQRGYYALPLLSQGQFIGHVDLKADRKSGKLEILSRQVARGHAHASAVRELAAFLNLRPRT